MTDRLHITVDGKRISVTLRKDTAPDLAAGNHDDWLNVKLRLVAGIWHADVRMRTSYRCLVDSSWSNADPQAALDAAFAVVEPWLSDGLREAISK
jgi:hypothetical protein